MSKKKNRIKVKNDVILNTKCWIYYSIIFGKLGVLNVFPMEMFNQGRIIGMHLHYKSRATILVHQHIVGMKFLTFGYETV